VVDPVGAGSDVAVGLLVVGSVSVGVDGGLSVGSGSVVGEAVGTVVGAVGTASSNLRWTRSSRASLASSVA
jgi:serine acetyltransferase